MMDNYEGIVKITGYMARRSGGKIPFEDLFDQLAEEMMELHLSIRGKHNDSPELEWLEIASIAISALDGFPPDKVIRAFHIWKAKHDRE